MKIEVLDHGYVELIDFMGSDYRILEAARISTGAQAKKGEEKDRGLIRYMYRNNHISPFEQCVFTFRIKMPLFVIQQWNRHRSQSLNQSSARYSEFTTECYVPTEWRFQDGTAITGTLAEEIEEGYSAYNENYTEEYDKMIGVGVSKEMARLVMPVSQYSELYTTMNLRNLFHLLELRLHPHAQMEIRVYAEAILKILESLDEFKWSMEAFKEDLEINTVVRDLKNRYKNFYASLKAELDSIK